MLKAADRTKAPAAEGLTRLEEYYGAREAVGPAEPYDMVLYVNCGYPANDETCGKGFEALKNEVGLEPEKILAAPKGKLAKLMRLGGIVPELRAERLKEIARRVKKEFGGDLRGALEKCLEEEKRQPGEGIRLAKSLLKKFPVIGEPGAEKILLFARLATLAAVPSAFVGVPMRVWFGGEGKNYVKDYRAAGEILSADVPEAFEARQRAYLLLKKHGQEICKRSKPKCEICPVSAVCAYFQRSTGID